ncbi:HAD-superfamily hydrolase- subfamily IG-5-nucleotidase [Striga hermonthica]|uniref:HAD-superfamily hydrolase- subfamily IG-5-nucleotidase n=1 Tax=Striga hermonthica TaxID=68872 RepID=A0A9N7P1R9_STRHE|nr:HAD-superfamily hydrolase- subfamily IG-5-nucleotidase [Striga hermonthica]
MLSSVVQKGQWVSGSADGFRSVLALEIGLSVEKKCLFNVKMRVARGWSISLCVSSFSASAPFPVSSSRFSPSISRFDFRFFCSSIFDRFEGARKVCHSAVPSNNKLHSNNTMDRETVQFERPTGIEADKHLHVWSSPEGGQKIDIGKKIFCNRSLNMRNIVAVGFDMDYTLAQYKPETFESLAYEGTVKKLVNDLGYPTELLEWSFDWTYMVRGLVLDKKRGNILKMDRHKYVKVAYHGFTELSKEEKVAAYGSRLIREAFDEPEYALIDTLFSLAEAYLFAQLVDFKDKNPGKIQADYSRMYKDVRAAVDLCHRDGTLKKMVAKDPKRYINEDSSIVPMLKMLRDSGRATFLVTNSLWDYTNIVMNFLCGPRAGDEGSVDSSLSFDWLRYFDVIITGSAKPGFFHDENRANLFQVEPESGMLLNTDNGTPMPQVDASLRLPLKSLDKSSQVFQGGNVGHLHKLLSIESSSQVLYVGDHIYGDILRSKKVLGWRTMLVVPELEKEVKLLWTLRDSRKRLQLLRNERDNIEDQIHHLKWSLRFDGVNFVNKEEIAAELDKCQSQLELVRLSHQEAQRECHQKFHKVWGQLMKTGYQNSRFAHQVERFACLYTSQVSNLSLYSPDKYYRPGEDFMPHEFDIISL